MNIQTIVVGPIQTNCYLITEKYTCILIDPGDDTDEIIGFIGNKTLQAILLTHGHFDHVLALRNILISYPATKVYLHKNDRQLASQAATQARMFGLAGENLNIRFNGVKDGDVIKFCNLNFAVIETPGHTPGSACYLLGNNLFSGDTLFKQSIGRTDLPGGSYSQMHSSLSKLAKLPNLTIVYPGHGSSTTIKEEKLYGFLNSRLTK